MQVGILGSGLMGGKLGTIFARTGHEVVFQLIRDMGFDPVNAGPLRIARYTESFARLVGQLAYEGENGPGWAYRFEWFRT